MKILLEKIIPVKQTVIVLQTCTVKIVTASPHAQTSLVDRMPIVTQKITLDGVVVELDSLKDQMAAYQNAKDIFVDKVLCVLSPRRDPLANVQLVRLEILSLEALA